MKNLRMKNMKSNYRKIDNIINNKGSDGMDNINEQFLKLINANKEDKDIIKNYLQNSNVDSLFDNYKELGLTEDTIEQIESIIIIIKNYNNM